MMDSHRDEIAKLESLYASNPEGRVFTHLAEACRKAGQLERAREILEEGLRRHPDYASAHVVLGRVLSDSGNAAAAADEFRRVLELDRHNLVALRSLGDLARHENRADEALYYYGELAVLDPTDGGIQEEIRRLRVQLAEGPSAAPAAAPPAPPAQPMAESAAQAEQSDATAAARPEGRPEPVQSEQPPVLEEAWPGTEADQPRELDLELPHAQEAAPEPMLAMPDLAGLTLEPPESEQPPTPEAVSPEVTAAWPGDAETLETVSGTEERVADAQAAGHTEGLTQPHWTDSQSVWPPSPPQKDLERRADLGDSGEWIPAERWEWMAASADSESAGAEAPPEAAEPTWRDEPAEAEPEPAGWMATDQAWQEQPRVEVEGFETEVSEIEVFQSESVTEFIESYESTEYLSVTPTVSESASGEDVDDEGDLVITETLAEIYATQGLFERAAAVYRRLLDQRPGDERLLARLQELESSAGWAPISGHEPEPEETAGSETWLERVESVWTGGEGAVSGEDSPYSWPAESTETTGGRPIGDYFRSLLSWRPGAVSPASTGFAATPSAPEDEPGTVDADPATSFDAWFSRESAPHETSKGEAVRGGAEADEDLEMFRSWLKSLKK